MRELVEDLHRVAEGGEGVPLRLHVANAHDSTGPGLHWITVAASIERGGAVCPSGVADDCEDYVDEEACFDDIDEEMERELYLDADL